MQRYSVVESGMVADDQGDWVRFDDAKKPATVILCGDVAKARELAERLAPEVDNIQLMEVMPPNQVILDPLIVTDEPVDFLKFQQEILKSMSERFSIPSNPKLSKKDRRSLR